SGSLELSGVRTNNLRNLEVSLEHGKMVVVTGPSGCGKSSLVFDTIFSEGKRQFLDSLSIQARQSLQYLPRAEVDAVVGLQPVVCVEQHKTRPNSRSTVGTVTEIYDHLRLLMSRVGTVHCSECHAVIHQTASDEIETSLLSLPEKTKLMLLAPLKSDESLASKLAEIRKTGFIRARVGQQVADLEAFDVNAYPSSEPVDAVIDRVVVKAGIEDRLSESISHALKTGGGSMVVLVLVPGAKDWEERPFSTLYGCVQCGTSYEEIETRTFSFNSPFGICPECTGLGVVEAFSFEMVFSRREVSLRALEVLSQLEDHARQIRLDELKSLMVTCGLGQDDPLSITDGISLRLLFEGNADQIGLKQVLEKIYVTTTQAEPLGFLEGFRQEEICQCCRGSRLCEAANQVYFSGKNLGEIVELSIDNAREFFRKAPEDLAPEYQEIALPILKEIVNRLEFLISVGAGYLTLGRRADSLSGGEFQRVRLATGIGNRLTDVCYILDEPTSGLHPADNQKLLETLQELKQLGNTIIVVEHEPEVMRLADQVIDLGPGAGNQGGEIVYQGSFESLVDSGDSITGRSLAPFRKTLVSRPEYPGTASWIAVTGATLNNLKGDEFRFPADRLVCVSGVSGSGKSSMVHGVLVPALQKQLGLNRVPGPFESITPAGYFSKVVEVDHQPIGRT
ncbi:MAG: ABC-ATPase UvrA, partial [Planctomycetota bacterium]|nr:ABC-ATPase UvrA [Planctomycetota bacterium]